MSGNPSGSGFGLEMGFGSKNDSIATFKKGTTYSSSNKSATLVSDPQVLNLTRAYIAKHQRDVVPIIEKYAEEWRLTGNPIYRPMWWLSPSDPMTFTIDDQFLIGDEVT